MVDRLQPDELLSRGTWLESIDKQFRLILREDANLITVRMKDGRIVWQTGTNGDYDYEAARMAPLVLRMQRDGNLVLQFDNDPLDPLDVLWASGTSGHPNSYVVQQNDGTVAVYDPSNKSVWRSNFVEVKPLQPGVAWPIFALAAGGLPLVSADGAFSVRMQDDGNVVLHRVVNMQPLWSTNTAVPGRRFGPRERFLRLQEDGNLVLYEVQETPAPEFAEISRKVIWSSNTAGNDDVRLRMQDDGNLVIYNNRGHAIWASGTANR